MSNEDLSLTCRRRLWRWVVKEFKDIEVTDGTLDVEFSCPPSVSPTARLCNAIEVLPSR